MRRLLVILLALVIVVPSVWYFMSRDEKGGTAYRFVEVTRGDIESVVSSTGTLDAVTTVEVGTQVSGIISEILVDFNEEVSKGQMIARLDTVPLSLAVQEASANLSQTLARLRYARENYARVSGLHEEGVVTKAELNSARYDFESAEAGADASRIKLELARRNLDYATVLAPIDGIVIERDVDVGQTVASSLSAPRLFLIAEDLAHMQILATVDESDIGRIAEGQAVRFTVQAWPDDRFTGDVRQVRLQSKQSENIVTYTVVVDVANPDLRLLPGMTATLDFIAETAVDVLLVPNSALRFRPSEDMQAELQARREAQRAEREGEALNRENPRGSFGGTGAAERPADFTLLYFLDKEGRLDAAPARTGIGDGSKTAITSRRLEEGMKVIAGITRSQESSSGNPFQQTNDSGGRRPPGPGF